LSIHDNNPIDIDVKDGVTAAKFVKHLADVCRDPLTNGFASCYCKQQLFVLKCFIEDQYKTLPNFPEQEKQWEQERLLEILKK